MSTIFNDTFDATIGAITKARKHYIFGTDNPAKMGKPLEPFRRNATSEIIDSCENFVNGPSADKRAIDFALKQNLIKSSPTSGHLFIQLD